MIFAPAALAGKAYFVTGGSSGLGRATAEALAQLGGRVVIVGRDQERLDAVIAGLAGEGHKAISASLSDLETTAEVLTKAAAELGGFDGVFHSAGAELVMPARMMKQKHLDEVLGAALFGGLGVAKAVCKANVMKPEGSVVLMSSAAARRGQTGMVAYSASKAAVEGLVRSLACELAPKGVRANAIAAGGVETSMHERLARSLPGSAIADYEAAHLLGFGRPDDVANAAVFLLSPASRWITGTTLDVDGGYAAS